MSVSDARRLKQLEDENRRLKRLVADLTLDNQMQVVVDRENYVGKLRRFTRLYRGVLSSDSRGVARVDLRYADGIAVTWRDQKA